MRRSCVLTPFLQTSVMREYVTLATTLVSLRGVLKLIQPTEKKTQQKLFSGFYRLEGLFVTICLYNVHL